MRLFRIAFYQKIQFESFKYLPGWLDSDVRLENKYNEWISKLNYWNWIIIANESQTWIERLFRDCRWLRSKVFLASMPPKHQLDRKTWNHSGCFRNSIISKPHFGLKVSIKRFNLKLLKFELFERDRLPMESTRYYLDHTFRSLNLELNKNYFHSRPI